MLMGLDVKAVQAFGDAAAGHLMKTCNKRRAAPLRTPVFSNAKIQG